MLTRLFFMLSILLSGCQETGDAAGFDSGMSVYKACVPECGNQECGYDSICGSPCGMCSGGTICNEGTCETVAPLAANGEQCRQPEECSSGICEMNAGGEMMCYGELQANEPCDEDTDCAGGSCLSPTGVAVDDADAGTIERVCTPWVNRCDARGVDLNCRDAAVAWCQMVQFCGSAENGAVNPRYTDFNYCVGIECSTNAVRLSPAECIQIVANANAGLCP